MNRLCSIALVLVLLGHQAQAFPKKKHLNSKLKSVPVENFKVAPADPGATMFTLNPWLSLTLPSNLIQPRLGDLMAHQTWAKEMRNLQKLNILNSMTVKKSKDQVKDDGEMISGKFRQSINCNHGGVFSSNRGQINFPKGGGNYHNNEECVWIINATHPLEITFSSFNLEANYDYLIVRDGNSSGSPILASLTGNIIPIPIETSTSAAYLKFTSDSSVTETGFVVNWEPSGCDYEYTSSYGSLSHPGGGGDYQNDEYCTFNIRTENPITITFVSFDTEQGYDFLYVRNGDSSGDILLDKFSGARVPSPIQTTANGAYLLFTSDYSVTRTGVSIVWEPSVIPPTEDPTTVAPTTASPTTLAPTTVALTTGTSSECACGQANQTPRIVNGIETEENEYPWQAALVTAGSSSVFCGASVIGSKHILTAAHCTQLVTDYSLSYQVLVGAHGLTTAASSQLRFDPTRFIQHADYDSSTVDNDISIIVLSDHIDFISSEIRPVCLPDNDADAYDSVMATVSGWGKIESGGSQPDVLLEVDVPTMTNTQCLQYYGGGITDNMLCAGYEEGGKDSCQGDSGGPLIYNSGSGYTQIGVVSWGYGCASAGYPGVYARVTKYLSWISDNSASSNTCSEA